MTVPTREGVAKLGAVRLRYRVFGDGPPVLALAPGGLRSGIDVWNRIAWNPCRELSSRYSVIAMDQRNAGGSWAPITADSGWADFTADQLALMEHLGHERFDVVGMCVGGTYGLRLCLTGRVRRAVLLQPIGLDGNRDEFLALVAAWKREVASAHPEADDTAFAAFANNMFSGEFLFGATRADARSCTTPLWIGMGRDLFHPESVSRELAALAPNATLEADWKQSVDATTGAIERFLSAD